VLTVSVVETSSGHTGGYSQAVKRMLSDADPGDQGRGRGLDVRMLLDSLVDSYRTVDGSTADSFAVEMEKRIS
jgi:hypothetical protein